MFLKSCESSLPGEITSEDLKGDKPSMSEQEAAHNVGKDLS